MDDQATKADDLLTALTLEAAKYGATIKRFDMAQRILDVDCPEDKKVDCAMALQKILDGMTSEVN